MTPKEKAQELVEKYYQSYLDNDVYGDYTNGPKECALIAVDEILEIISSDESMLITELQFWQEVKKEINNL